MQKILIIGCSGAGKSTFARKLGAATGLPLHYLDMLWHKPDKTTVPQEEFDRALEELLQQDRWIIDGNYLRTLERRLQACDTVFLLDYPLSVCLSGVQGRIGQKREDMPWIETEFDTEFRQWIIDFPQQRLPQVYALLNQYRQGRTVVIFHSRQEAQEYLDHFPG